MFDIRVVFYLLLHWCIVIQESTNKLKVQEQSMKRRHDEIKYKQLPTSPGFINYNNGASDPAVTVNHQYVLIIGGQGDGDQSLNTVQEYNITRGTSIQFPRMIKPRSSAASCVYHEDVIVVGGDQLIDATNTIEILRMKQYPLEWAMFEGELPCKLYSHTVACHDDKLYVIGGHNCDSHRISDVIYELLLTAPYSCKPLKRMPQPRSCHSTAIVKDKMLIFGGYTTGKDEPLDSILQYDLDSKRLKVTHKLPNGVSCMSSVVWGNYVILIGGEYRKSQYSHEVIIYDPETGECDSQRLPSLKLGRSQCSAVIIDNVIFVYGGWTEDDKGVSNSVEKLKIGDKDWKVLPGMMEGRCELTCVVKPQN